MKLDDLTPQQMAQAARSLAYCIETGAYEDAHNWLVQLMYSLHQQFAARRAMPEAAFYKPVTWEKTP